MISDGPAYNRHLSSLLKKAWITVPSFAVICVAYWICGLKGKRKSRRRQQKTIAKNNVAAFLNLFVDLSDKIFFNYILDYVPTGFFELYFV